jgi:hypothetical protein
MCYDLSKWYEEQKSVSFLHGIDFTFFLNPCLSLFYKNKKVLVLCFLEIWQFIIFTFKKSSQIGIDHQFERDYLTLLWFFFVKAIQSRERENNPCSRLVGVNTSRLWYMYVPLVGRW